MKENELQHLYTEYVVPTYRRSIAISHGQGSFVWDIAGSKLLDMCQGVATNALGHAHPAIMRALNNQASMMMHVSNLYYTELQGLLAEKIVKLSHPGKVFFCNTGAEANEALIKLARRHGLEKGRYEVIVMDASFHGRTMATISATGNAKVREGFDPLLPGFVHVPFNDTKAVENAITPRTAAVLVEGIQGEGGIHVASEAFLSEIRKITRQAGILMLMDEVQCGCFRTGSFLSHKSIVQGNWARGFQPDAVSLGKSLGGGYPIGAMWVRSDYADVLSPGTHGTTLGGNPLACAVSLAVLETIEKEALATNITRAGRRLTQGLNRLARSRPIKEIRGFAGMIGIQVEDGPATKKTLEKAGLLMAPAAGNVLRFLPALNVSEDEIDLAIHILQENL